MQQKKNEDNDGMGRSTGEVNDAIRDLLKRSSRIKISGMKGQDNIAIGLSGSSEIDIKGDVGRYLGAFNSGPVIVLRGNAGDLAGDSLRSGGLIIIGDCGTNTGLCMGGGIIVVKGNCGHNCGRLNDGGTLIIDGNVDGDAGTYMKRGKMIITGDVSGTLGKISLGGSFFVSGTIKNLDSSLYPETPTEHDNSMLKKYFDHYGIDAFAMGFTKYVNKGVKSG